MIYIHSKVVVFGLHRALVEAFIISSIRTYLRYRTKTSKYLYGLWPCTTSASQIIYRNLRSQKYIPVTKYCRLRRIRQVMTKQRPNDDKSLNEIAANAIELIDCDRISQINSIIFSKKEQPLVYTVAVY